ncbi:MAG: hypothetical protein AABY53_04950 [Bdellovibrionota bacterium]
MFKKINAKIEDLFDQPESNLQNTLKDLGPVATSVQNNFQSLNNNKMLENLSYIFSSEVNSKNLTNLFLQLSSYFEIGFLLQKDQDKGSSAVIASFVFGKNIEIAEGFKTINLPNPGICNVVKSSAHQILTYFNIENLDPENKMMSYLIPLSTHHSIVVMTETAEPWANLKIESLQKMLMKINFNL